LTAPSSQAFIYVLNTIKL